MAFIQLAARRSMRDGPRSLAAAGNRLYHWGLKSVARSTFADANNSRPVGFFKDLFGKMYALCATKALKHKFRFKLCSAWTPPPSNFAFPFFPWAAFRQAKGGIKMHTVLDHNGGIPVFATVTEAKTHESRIAKVLELHEGSIVVFDKGYIDYSWFRELGQRAFFS